MKTTIFQEIIPVLPSADIARDVKWYEEQIGFIHRPHGDDLYALLRRDRLNIHLQWHADTEEDPLLGGSVIKIWVQNIQPLFDEFVERGTVHANKIRMNTPWGTNEFGFFDLNSNAIFFVEDAN